MAGATLEIDDRQLIAALTRLQALVGDLAPVYRDLGAEIQRQTEQRFRDQIDPDGRPWQEYAPLSQEYARIKPRNQNKILVLDGGLSGELRYQESSAALEVGTNKIYGATHQFGRPEKNIPARPFLGLSQADEADLLAIIEYHIQQAL